MFIFLIGYLYVIVMFAAGTGSLIKGSGIFLIFGLFPTWLFMVLWRRKQMQRQHKKSGVLLQPTITLTKSK
jgi:sulfite exporter TauE/SafE